MARTLDQIVAELNPTYQPQIDSLRTRQAAIPGQIEAEEKGLQAKQESAFGDILSGARRRGLGFSGIPLAEQAKYTSTEFLPALARLRQSAKEQQMSLEDAILGISERRNTLAQQLRQQEVDREEQVRQFNENLRLQREQMAASERASRASSGAGFSPSLGAFGGGASAAPATVTPEQQGIYSQAKRLFGAIGNEAWATSELSALKKSAERGNARDKQVLQQFYNFRVQSGKTKQIPASILRLLS